MCLTPGVGVGCRLRKNGRRILPGMPSLSVVEVVGVDVLVAMVLAGVAVEAGSGEEEGAGGLWIER
jgi:hypothetical protein